MTERTDDWRSIFTDLTDDSWLYETDNEYLRVNIYKLASHLEELYLKIEELETQLKDVQELVIAQEYGKTIGL